MSMKLQPGNRWGTMVWVGLATLLLSACGPAALTSESWTLIDVVTTGERIDRSSEIVDVRNCGVPAAAERKSRSCSASFSTSFSVGSEASAGAAAGVVLAELDVSVSASVATTLGFDRNSGDSLELDTPPPGFVNRYNIIKEFSITTGRGQIRSESGAEEEGFFAVQTGCSLRIYEVATLTCDAADLPTPTPVPTERPIPPVPTPTETVVAAAQPASNNIEIRTLDGIPFARVPAGEFTMGSNDGFDNEKPQHQVYVDEFWIMQTEVTNAQYARCVSAGDCSEPNNEIWDDAASATPSRHRCGLGTGQSVCRVDWRDGCPPKPNGKRPHVATMAAVIPGETLNRAPLCSISDDSGIDGTHCCGELSGWSQPLWSAGHGGQRLGVDRVVSTSPTRMTQRMDVKMQRVAEVVCCVVGRSSTTVTSCVAPTVINSDPVSRFYNIGFRVLSPGL